MSFLLFTTLAVFLGHVAAAPTIRHPVTAQRPVIARINEAYDFRLLYDTFTSSAGLTYATGPLPAWLAFDNTTLSFSGTPSAADVGTVDVVLTATDTTPTADTFTILVSAAPAPAVHQGFPTQIRDLALHQFNTARALPSGQGVYIHPYYSFSMGFQQSTFRAARNAPGQDVFYSARLRGDTQAPGWLNFDNETVTFSGTAPAGGSYTVVVTGSDVWGYTAVENSFVIEVGETYVDVEGVLANVTTTAGSAVAQVVDLGGVTVGGGKGEVGVEAELDEFPWLKWDAPTLTLSGTTPEEYINTSSTRYVPLTLSAEVNGSAATLVEHLPLRIVPSLFTSLRLPNTTAKPGTAFSYPLAGYLKNATAVRGLTATFNAANGNLSSWLSLDEKTYTLSGTVPNATELTKKRAVTGDTQISVILAALDANGVGSTANVDIAIAGVAASQVTTALPTATGSSAPAAAHSGGLSNAAKIGLGVGLGLGGALLLVLLAFCCLRRRRKQRQASAKPAGRKSTDGDSFVGMVKSPNVEKDAAFAGLPRSHSARLDQGEVPTFSSVYLQRPEANEVALGQELEEPQRMKAMHGILNLQAKPEDRFGFPGVNDSPVQGEIIRQESLNVPSRGGSDFTHDFTTSESRASWESRGSSFHWSSNEGRMTPDANGRPLSGAASIPRPRPDFAPRYPRHATPGAMRLVRQPSTGSGQTFSEFDGGSPKSPDSLAGSQANTSFGTRMNTSSGSGLTLSPEGSSRSTVGFSSGKSGLGQFIGSERFSSVDEEEENQHAPYDHGEHHGELRLMPSRERFAVSPTQDEFMPQSSRTPSEEAIMESPPDAFDDAEEEVKRESAMYNAAQLGDLQALGYPADSIVFGSPTTTDRTSFPAGKRVSSMRAVPERDIAVMSPPMPMGNMLRTSLERNRQTNDGRYIALVNETFNLHPALTSPPSVSLSAATWTAQAPSTYRAERMDGSALPAWLRWDTKEFTLWGIPPTDTAEEVIEVRIMERIPKEKRKNYDSSLYQPSQLNGRQVGHVVIQVTDGMKSPDAFDLEAWGRA